MLYPEAFVLHRYGYSENSLIVKFLIPELPILSVLAKGIKGGSANGRRNKNTLKNNAGLCEPFNLLSLECSGMRELKTLKYLDLLDALGLFKRLSGDILTCGLYLNELLINLLGPAPCSQRLFNFYKKTLISLSQSVEIKEVEPALRYFEKVLLEELGHCPDFYLDCLGQAIQPDQYYEIVAGGAFKLSQISQENLNKNNKSIEGRVLLEINLNNFEDEKILQEAKSLFRYFLDFYLNGKILKTRSLIRTSLIRTNLIIGSAADA